jgi:uncharacterized repeat protein (TIGR01451 family)
MRVHYTLKIVVLMLFSALMMVAPQTASAAITTVACTNNANSAGKVNTLSLNTPAGTQVNDLMVATIINGDPSNTVSATGWTQIVTRTEGGVEGVRLTLLYKRAVSGEPGSRNFTFTSNTNNAGGICSYRGVAQAPVNPIDASTIISPGTLTSGDAGYIDIPSLTPTGTGRYLVGAVGVDGKSTDPDPPGSMLQHYQVATAGSDQTGTISSARQDWPSNTPTGTRRYTVSSANSDDWIAAGVLLRPQVVDLRMVKTSSNDFQTGNAGSYTLTVYNDGPSNHSGSTITVTDTLPTGITYTGYSGAGWTCSAVGQNVTCTTPDTINNGASKAVTLNITVGSGAASSVTNTATVSSSVTDPDLSDNSGSNITSVQKVSDLSIDKARVGSFIVGQNGVYRLSVTNNGPDAATGGLSITDTLPAGLSYVSYTGASWSCAAVGQLVTCSRASSLGGGSSSSVDITVSVAAGAHPSVSNTATVSGANLDLVPGNNSDTDMSAVTASANIGISKTHVGNFVRGTTGSYTLAVSNAGPMSANNVTITDTLPAGLTYQSYSAGAGWSCSAAGQVVTCTRTGSYLVGTNESVVLTVGVGQSTAASITNTATITASEHDSSAANNSSSDPTNVVSRADLAVFKSHVGDFTSGAAGNYSIYVQNLGPSTEPGPIEIVDTLPAALSYTGFSGSNWTCSAAGQTVTCQYTQSVLAGASTSTLTLNVLAVGNYATATNTVTASGTVTDLVPANNTASDPTNFIRSADLALTKTHVGNFVSGQDHNYTLTVTNNGPRDEVATITVTDTLPAGLTYQSASGVGWSCSAAGQVVTCNQDNDLNVGASTVLTLTVRGDADAATSVTNTATVSSPTLDVVPGNDTASDPTTIIRSVNLGLTKTHVGDFQAGSNGTYTLAVSNTGADNEPGAVTVIDTLPAELSYVGYSGTGWSCSAAGQVVTCIRASGLNTGSSSSVNLIVSALSSGSPTNTAVVSSPSTDSNPANNTASDPTTIDPLVDLSISKSAVGVFRVGSVGEYTLTVSNAGPSVEAGPITLTDTLPTGLTYLSYVGAGWSCSSIGQAVSCIYNTSLASGASTVLTLRVDVWPSAWPSVTNTASVSSASTDSNPVNNTSSAITSVDPLVDLQIDKSHMGDFTVGQTGVYQLQVENLGALADPGPITVTDTLPASLSYQGYTGIGWSCSATGQDVTCTRTSSLAALASSTVAIQVLPSTPGNIINTASVAGSATDSNNANNSDSDPTTILAQADLVLSKTHTGNFRVGDLGTHTLQVINNGPSDDPGPIEVTDTLPPGLVYSSYTGAGWSCTVTGQTVTCVFAAGLVDGASASVDIHVDVEDSAWPSVTNTATVTGSVGDPDTSNNEAVDVTAVDPMSDLALSKTHTGTFQEMTVESYALQVTNLTNIPNTGPIQITDTLPAELTYESAAGTNWSCSAIGQDVTCDYSASLPGGASTTLTLNVNVVGSGNITNTATVQSAMWDNDLANNTSADPTSISAMPRAGMSIVKSHTGDFALGGTHDYTMTVANAGPDNPSMVTVTDTLPAGLTYFDHSGTDWNCIDVGQDITCQRTSLAAGDSSELTLTVTVDGTLGATVSNTAEVTSDLYDDDLSDNTSTDIANVLPTSDISLTKTHIGSFGDGLIGEYELTVTNSGFAADPGPVQIVDTLPASLTYDSHAGAGWSCTAAGQVVTCDYGGSLAIAESQTLILRTLASGTGSVTNEAVASGSLQDSDPSNNSAQDVTSLEATTDLELNKTHASDFTVGQSGAYDLTVTNNGPSDHPGPFQIVDTLPTDLGYDGYSGPGWSCSVVGQIVTCIHAGSLLSGASSALQINATPAPAAVGSVINTATVSSALGDLDPSNNTATDPTTVLPMADLSITKTHIDNFQEGDTGEWTITVENLGPNTHPGPIEVVETLHADTNYASVSGAGWSCIDAGTSITCTYAGTLDPGDSTSFQLVINVGMNGLLDNPTTVQSSVYDPDSANNSIVDATIADPIPRADLSITKTHLGDMTVGEEGVYYINAINNGPDRAVDPVEIIDTLPTGMSYVSATFPCTATGQTVVCSDGNALEVGESIAFEMRVLVDQDAYPQAVNTVSINSTTLDSNSADNTAVDVTNILPQTADLRLGKTHVGDFTAGSNGRYTLSVTNHGPYTAQAPVTITDTLPTGMSYLSTPSPSWACSAAGQIVTCEYANPIPNTGSAILLLDVNIDPSAGAGTVTNSAAVSSTTPDPIPGNNGASDDTSIVLAPPPSADLAISKTSDGILHRGQEEVYTIIVTNNGPDVAPAGTEITDALPPGLEYVNASPGCINSSGVVTCTLTDSTPVGGSENITITTTVSDTATGTIVNTASVSGPIIDPQSNNDTDSDSATVYEPSADLSIVKSTVGEFTVGSHGTYNILVTNNGPDRAETITVRDTLPAGLTYVSAQNAGELCSHNNGTVTCSIAGLNPDDSTTIQIVVNIGLGAYPQVVNEATASSATPDLDLANNTSRVSTRVNPEAQHADLALTLVAKDTNMIAGKRAEHTLTIANRGPNTAVAPLTIKYKLMRGQKYLKTSSKGWVCTSRGMQLTCQGLRALRSGKSATLKLILSTSPAAKGSAQASARVSSLTEDRTQKNNTATLSKLYTNSHDISLTNTVKGDARRGGELTYTLRVTNKGPSTTTGVLTLTDTMSTKLESYRVLTKGWACKTTGQKIECSWKAIMQPEESQVLRISGKVRDSASGEIANDATVASVGSDSVSANNSATAKTAVAGMSEVAAPKIDEIKTNPYNLPRTGLELLGLFAAGTLLVGLGLTMQNHQRINPSYLRDLDWTQRTLLGISLLGLVLTIYWNNPLFALPMTLWVLNSVIMLVVKKRL